MKKTLALVALFATFCLSLKAQDEDAEYARDMFKAGDRLPSLSVPDLAGNPHSIGEFRGKYVVLDFWATWCPDCRKEIPVMKQLYEKYASDQVVFVGISFDTDRKKLESYLVENEIKWMQLSDFRSKKESSVATGFKIRWIPALYLVDPEGRVALSTVMTEKLAAELSRIAPKQ